MNHDVKIQKSIILHRVDSGLIQTWSIAADDSFMEPLKLINFMLYFDLRSGAVSHVD